MTMPIRHTTTRLVLTGAMALGTTALVAGPALAQYPPPPIEVTVTTPGATIEVNGSNWGPGTTVTITRKNGAKAGQATTRGSGGDAASTESVTVTVADDGTFTAPIEVPADAGGTEVQYEVTGVDEQGEEKSETRALNVQLTSADMAPDAEAETELAAPAPVDQDGGPGLALAAAGVAAVAGGAAVARRKVRQG